MGELRKAAKPPEIHSETLDVDDLDVLRPREASQYLGGVPTSTLSDWRSKGIGPRFARYGRFIVYRKQWLDDFIDGHSATTTTEAKRIRAKR
jgi:hypothetical protein